MAERQIVSKLRQDYPGVLEEYLDSQPLWGFQFTFARPLGSVALHTAEACLTEQLEVEAFQLPLAEDALADGQPLLQMIVRGVSARRATTNAQRVLEPCFGPDRHVDVPIIAAKPLMPEEAMKLFNKPDVGIPDITNEFFVMMNEAIL